MSQENVELVRQTFAAFAEHETEAAVPFNAPDVVIYSMPEWPDDPVYHGHDGFRKLARAGWRTSATSASSFTSFATPAILSLLSSR